MKMLIMGTKFYFFYTVTVLKAYIGDISAYSVWPLLALCISSILLSLVAISQFKKRVLQIRLCVFNILLIVGFYAMLAWYYWILKDWTLEDGFLVDKIAFNWTVVLPAINIILIYLSIRAIGRDEALVRATERLR